MKVLLISGNTLTNPYPVYPLGIDYVASAIERDHDVHIADMNAVKDYEVLGSIIRQFSPNVIGISIRNIDNTDTSDPRGFIGIYRELVEVIRSHSKAPLVLGGSGFTIFPSEIMRALNADYGIIGEGERFALLLRALEEKAIGQNADGIKISNIPGVIMRENEEQIPPPWDNQFSRNMNLDTPHIQFYLKHGGMLNLQTQRGCNFKCIYCTYPHIEGKTLRLIQPEEVANTALKLQAAGAKYFFITDSAFNVDVAHSMEIAREFIKAKISIPWGAFIAPTELPDDYFKLMADAKLTHVEFGTESLNNEVLSSYRKPFRVNHVLKAHEAAISAGLYAAHYILLGGPGETVDTLDETLSRVDKLTKTVLFFFCGMRIYPYTALFDLALKEGQITKMQNLLEPVFYRSKFMSGSDIIRRVEEYAAGRVNWIIGSGGDNTAKILSKMYARGYTGPLWEYLIR